MRNTTPISAIMSKKPATVSPSDNMDTVRKVFEQYGFHHVPVTENGRLTGIVSYTDYLRIISGLYSGGGSSAHRNTGLEHMQVQDIMTKDVFSFSPMHTIDEALEAFRTHHFHAIPVVEADQRLVGIISTYDLMKVLEQLLSPAFDYASADKIH